MVIKQLKLFNIQSVIYLTIIITQGAALASFGVVFRYITETIQLKQNLMMPIMIFSIISLVLIIAVSLSLFWKEKTKYRFEQLFKKEYLTSVANIKYQEYSSKTMENELLYDSQNVTVKYLMGKIHLFAGIVQLIAISITIGYLSLSILPIAIIINIIVVLIVVKLRHKSSTLQEKISYNREWFLKESSNMIEGYEDMASFSTLNKLPFLFKNVNLKYYHKERRLLLLNSFLTFIIPSLGIMSSVVMNLFIFGFAKWSLITIPSVIAFFGANTHLKNSLTNIRNEISGINSIKNISTKLETKHDTLTIKNKKSLFPIKLNHVVVKLKNININYPQITLEMQKKYYITGSNGSGKSIMMKIISGIHNHSDGDITYGGKNLNELEINNKIIYLDTKPLIFPGIIKENIDISNIPSLFKKIMHVLPDLDKSAEKLSLGQKQLINLIRAFQLKKEILILDEAISGISQQNTTILENILNQSDKTILYITHNKRTEFKYDKKIELK